MMIDNLLRVGDEVILTIGEESRAYGYNPYPDGTKAAVLSLSEIHYGRLNGLGMEPGVYENSAWATVVLENGAQRHEWTGRFDLSDTEEYERRLQEFRALQKRDPDGWNKRKMLRPLPETPFWEGDFVRVWATSSVATVTRQMPPNQDPDIFQIVRIDYDYLNETIADGLPYPVYQISDKISSGWHTSAQEADMKLVERGPVWNYYHGIPNVFKNIKEEADFYQRLGRATEVRNPRNELYSWTHSDVLDAIKNGVAHGFSLSSGFFGDKHSIYAVRYQDEEVGQRVAQATLEGFNVSV